MFIYLSKHKLTSKLRIQKIKESQDWALLDLHLCLYDSAKLTRDARKAQTKDQVTRWFRRRACGVAGRQGGARVHSYNRRSIDTAAAAAMSFLDADLPCSVPSPYDTLSVSLSPFPLFTLFSYSLLCLCLRLIHGCVII